MALSHSNTNEILGGFEIIHAYFSYPETLKQNGYTPKRLANSAEWYLDTNKHWRARMQYQLMLRIDATEEEMPHYEKSGTALEKHGYTRQAEKHYTKAFDAGYRPRTVNMRLGQCALKNGSFEKSGEALNYQLTKTPLDPVIFNEYGVLQTMLATSKSESKHFYSILKHAEHFFDQSYTLQKNPSVLQNKKAANALTFEAIYEKPFTYLETSPLSSTSIIDAIMQDLTKNKEQTKSASGSGFSVANDPNGSIQIQPTFTHTTYKVPYYPNYFLLNELSKIKKEEPSYPSGFSL